MVNTEDVVFFWGAARCERVFTGRFVHLYQCVRVWGSSADRSISRFCTDNKNRRGCVDKLNLFSVMLNLKNVPLQWPVTPVLSSCGGMTSPEQLLLREPIDTEL